MALWKARSSQSHGIPDKLLLGEYPVTTMVENDCRCLVSVNPRALASQAHPRVHTKEKFCNQAEDMGKGLWAAAEQRQTFQEHPDVHCYRSVYTSYCICLVYSGIQNHTSTGRGYKRVSSH